MVTTCLSDLKPFIITYFCFGNFFVVLYAVLEVQIDEELTTPGAEWSMGYYGLLFLAMWRNSVGKLGMPNYDKIAEGPPGLSLTLDVEIIWVVYFVQIMFQLVIGLNFMIAIIE